MNTILAQVDFVAFCRRCSTTGTMLNFTHELRLRSNVIIIIATAVGGLENSECKARIPIMGCLIPISHTNISHILVWCKATTLPLSAHLSSVEMESQRGQKAQGVTAGAQSHGKWQITTLMSAIYHLFPIFSLPFSHFRSFFPLSSTFSSKWHDYLVFYYNKSAVDQND